MLVAVIGSAPLSAATQRFDISDHGAVGDGKTLNTVVIQAVIDQCAAQGGGTLVVPKGEFVSGALFLKPGVNVELRAGAVLKGSTNIGDYPKANTRIEGHFEPWPAALLNGDKVDHLRLTGPGTLDGSGATFWQEFYRQRKNNHKTTNLNVERPRLVFIQNSEDVQVSGVNFNNSGFWNLHLYRCRQVTVENCRFESPHGGSGRAPSTDGMDVDSSQDVTISKSFFSVGDDCIALKGSKGPFAMQDKDSRPVERIHIRDCIFKAGGGIVTFGSEATVVRDVDVERCTSLGVAVLRLKLRADTPQLYENIRLHDLTLEHAGVLFSIAPWDQYFDLKGQPPPKSVVRNITIADVKGSCESLGRITGNPATEIEGIVLKDAEVEPRDPNFEVGQVKGLKFDHVVVNGRPMPAPTDL
jgi:alpha-L-rhamnosidase